MEDSQLTRPRETIRKELEINEWKRLGCCCCFI